jgi:hypothetical protein
LATGLAASDADAVAARYAFAVDVVTRAGVHAGDCVSAALDCVPRESAAEWWESFGRRVRASPRPIPEDLEARLRANARDATGQVMHPDTSRTTIPEDLRQEWARRAETPLQGRFWRDDTSGRVHVGLTADDFGTIEASDLAWDVDPDHYPVHMPSIIAAFARGGRSMWAGRVERSELREVVRRTEALDVDGTHPAWGGAGQGAAVLLARWSPPAAAPTMRDIVDRHPEAKVDPDPITANTVWVATDESLAEYLTVHDEATSEVARPERAGDLRMLGVAPNGERLHAVVSLVACPSVAAGDRPITFAVSAAHLHHLSAFVGGREVLLDAAPGRVVVGDFSKTRIALVPTLPLTALPVEVRALARAMGMTPAAPDLMLATARAEVRARGRVFGRGVRVDDRAGEELSSARERAVGRIDPEALTTRDAAGRAAHAMAKPARAAHAAAGARTAAAARSVVRRPVQPRATDPAAQVDLFQVASADALAASVDPTEGPPASCEDVCEAKREIVIGNRR